MSVLVLAGRIVALGPSLGATDPLGPSDFDPDGVRDRACSVTTPSRLCDLSPASDDVPDPPDLPDAPDPGVASLLANLVLLVLVVLLVVGIAFLVTKLWKGGATTDDDIEVDDEELDETVDGVLGARVVDHDSPPHMWRTRADGHAARGEYRDAVRCRYRALVGDLARAGYVDEIPGRTSGEERAQVADTVGRLPDAGAAAEHVVGSFDRSAGIFDSAWFDDIDVLADDLRHFVDAERVVIDAIASGPGVRRARVGSRS